MKTKDRAGKGSTKRTKEFYILVFGGIFTFICVCLVGFIIIYDQMYSLGTLFPGMADRSQPSPTLAAPLAVEGSPSPTPIPALLPRPAMISYTPSFEPGKCQFPVPEGAIVDCGFVTVPEDRYADANDTIRLAVAVYRSREGAAADIPVIYLQGGPGQEAIASMNKVYTLLIEPIIQNRDFIVFDQRGIGFSQPNLDCPDLKTLYMQDLTHQVPTSERTGKYTQTFSLCKEQLESQGVNVSAYNTLESAGDIRDIITALGYQQATLFGVSYGTRLAQVVMREHPDAVHSAVLDSVLPLDVKIFNQGSATSEMALRALFDGCAADPNCSSLYPNFEADFWDLVAALDAQPKWVTVYVTGGVNYKRSVDGLAFVNAIIWALRSPELIPEIPQLMYRVRGGETAFLGAIMAIPSYTVSNINIGAYLSINCREQVYSTTPEEVLENLASHPNTEEIGLAWVYGDPQFMFALCNAWQVDVPYIDEMTPVVSDKPVLLLAGQYDSTTPPFFATRVAERLSQAQLVEFPGQGHAVAFSSVSNCPRDVLFAFLGAQGANVDTACVNSMGLASFSTPYTGHPPLELHVIRDAQYGLVTKVPMKWRNIGNGFYNRNQSGWDMTQLGVQQAQASVDTWLSFLMENFAGEGLDSYPLKMSEMEANGMIWGLYETTYRGYHVDLALAQHGFQTMMVAMLSHTDEREALYQTVFLEAIKGTISQR